jgi:hypothetical protein
MSTTMNMDVNAVGAMDVSGRRSAAEYDANVIARSDDRATTCATAAGSLRNDR